MIVLFKSCPIPASVWMVGEADVPSAASLRETKPCPVCGMLMILHETGMVLQSCPPLHVRGWWCKCGHEEEAPPRRDKTRLELLHERWEAAQKKHRKLRNRTNA